MKQIYHRSIAFIDRWHWLWLGLAAPFMLFPSPKRVLALFIVPGLWFIAWLVSRHRKVECEKGQSDEPQGAVILSEINLLVGPVPRTPINSSLLLLFFMVLISLYATYDIGVSLPKISGMVLGVGVFFSITRLGERASGWWTSLIAYLGMGAGIAGIGLLGTAWFTNKITFLNPIISRLPGFEFGLPGVEAGFHPNEVAGSLLWVLPVLIVINVLLLHKRRTMMVTIGKWRTLIVLVVTGGAMLLLALIFLLTQSRGGYIGFTLTMLLLTLIALPTRWRWLSLGVLLIALIALWIAIPQIGIEVIFDQVSESQLASNPALSVNSFAFRSEIWSRAIYGIQDFAFTGMGMNTFRKVVHVLYPLFLIAPDFDLGHAHNEFLQAALDLGIPGLIAFVGINIGALWMLIDIWRVASSSLPITGSWSFTTRALTLGLAGGLLAHMLFGLTDAVALGAKPGFLFWMLLGLITSLHNQIKVNRASDLSYAAEWLFAE